MPPADLHLVYRETRLRLLDLAPTLSPTQLATMTPSCPAWSVKDVLAHLSGLAGDLTSGIKRAGAPEHTARQVATRSAWDVHEICDEWAVTGPALEARIAAESSRLRAPVIDIWTHEQDLANAAGIESGRNGAGLELAMSVAWAMKHKLRDAGLAPIRIVTDEVDWVIGDEDPAATVRTTSYELARAVLGRRSLDQIRAYEWSGDPAPYLAHFTYFSPPEYPIIEADRPPPVRVD